MFSHDGEAIDAAAGLLLVRAGIGFEQAFSVEAALGATRSDAFGGLGVLGVYWSFYYIDLGFSGQVPFAPQSRPEWLAGANLGIRINAPIYPDKLSIQRHSPLPTKESDVLAGFRHGADESREEVPSYR